MDERHRLFREMKKPLEFYKTIVFFPWKNEQTIEISNLLFADRTILIIKLFYETNELIEQSFCEKTNKIYGKGMTIFRKIKKNKKVL